MKIAISTSSFDLKNNPVLDELRAIGAQIVTNPYQRKLAPTETVKFLENVVGLIAGVEILDSTVLSQCPDLRVISRCGAGLDNIDETFASASGIAVRSTPDAPTTAVAELTIGLILSSLRHIAITDREIRNGVWKQRYGRLLGEQTVGIIGYGRIGKNVAHLLRGFGCEILVHDDIPHIELGRDQVSLETLIEKSDVVCLHVPLTSNTRGLISSKEFTYFKSDAVIVNTSRGEIIDEKALQIALDKGQIGFAALDTFEREPYAGPLTNNDNVLLTAHIGSYAIEARRNMEICAMRNLVDALEITGDVNR